MKILISFSLIFVLIASLQAAPPSGIPHPIKLSKDQLQPFLKKYCIQCHGPKKQKGDMRFDREDWFIKDNDTAQRWQDVLDQLNGGDMPPEEEDQPSNAEMAGILRTLTGSVNEAQRRLTDHGGEIKMRRLNKREYANTIRDLFGFDIQLDDIPIDGEIVTFDTVGAEQFFSSAHFEKYLRLGRKIATQSLNINTQRYQDIKTEKVQPEKRVTAKMRKDLADKDRKRALKKAGKGWKEMGFKDEGAMKILFSQWDSRAELPRNYLKYPKVDSGVYISDVAKWVPVSRHVDIRADYTVRVHGGVVGEVPEQRKIIRLYKNRIYGTLKLKGTPQNPQTVSLTTRNPMGEGLLSVLVRENVPDDTINTLRGYLKKLKVPGKHVNPRAAVWIDWLEIEGPFYPEKRPLFEELLYPNMPTGSKGPYLNHDKKTRELLEQFATIAFREKNPDPAFLEALYQNYKQNRASGMKYKQALAESMGIILASPSFLFIQESIPAQEKPHAPLTNHELAVRLSYFLWSSPPDSQLYHANLSDPAIYAQQVDRMIANPKLKFFRDGFISQWAEFDRYDAITIDTKEHFLFNQGLQQDAKHETREFFGTLIKENLPVSNLIDSDFITINSALAAHYGIPGVESEDDSFQKVKLPANSPRGGLLTQVSFLTTGSNGERSSPVIRGALVLEKILHDKPAPPPPNVPELDEASKKPMSNKQMVLLHQKRASCASCHKTMDVIGFGLENFDTIGRWRDTEKVGKKQVPIEPGGELPSGYKFKNIQQLKKLLLTQDKKLAMELTSSIMSYGLGRTIEFSDADDIAEIVTKLKANNYRARDLLKEVAVSPLFKKR